MNQTNLLFHSKFLAVRNILPEFEDARDRTYPKPGWDATVSEQTDSGCPSRLHGLLCVGLSYPNQDDQAATDWDEQRVWDEDRLISARQVTRWRVWSGFSYGAVRFPSAH